ncbi:insulin-like growth factor 1 receptor [Venturia canescens]|uniref:insulin-like growth factor 1 receptor n=1 Tax=Venturia canescens TaxID=32260 RepID=UPI001C9C5EF1|nr:insulin-like growth factor 1 receptor [Venturia canescens]XP_043284805.1 insulin-like growth factor 1 receptor [Venturia canescens]XP_043284806.1 insulin-like growth factor 1 receptor [Venturia canescens]XP_043284807.1 insulin-like growth factor 1 receptor [Venturia canescens]XP_043284808.1 insulin-like growth factor 1 receptor [Venturia canescens]XP_043284809.1 insulin-like growth factor 1 receptor [Venturia canescens]
MRTRKLLISLVVYFLLIGYFVHSQENPPRPKNKYDYSFYSKQSDKTVNGKYKSLDSDKYQRGKQSLGVDDPHFTSKTDQDSQDQDYAYQNNGTVDAPAGSLEGMSEEKSNQSTSTSKPKEYVEPSESSSEKNLSKQKVLTIADGVCSDIDIRNNVDSFKVLEDCHVIEGFLQIVLIENDSEDDFQNISFPKLREVTDFVLIYRVNNLKTLGGILPNLEVIRGDVLFADYSFMIYEMQNLQEIGLNRLTEISRGAVRIEKNPSLCYLSTLDWGLIVRAGENFIKDNSNEAPCPVCSHCPNGRCWNAKHCQKTEKQKCHEQCLSECDGPTEADCYVCKNFQYQGRCVENCPSHLFAYRSRRCITKEECLRVNTLPHAQKAEETGPWRPFNGSCLVQCPHGFEEAIDENNLTTCRVCDGLCRKVGRSAIIRHVADAQIFRGTMIIKGALEFQIRNGNPTIMNELTEAFGMVEEITEYLKVTHSFPLTSLGFFKKLRVIRGEKLDINNASLLILDNPNLSDLFPEDQQIEIQKGRLFFHYNPKLCLSRIERLGRMVGITNFTHLEVQRESNGEKVACDIVDINIRVDAVGPNYANLVWDSYKPHRDQQLLSYLLNYIETDNDNISYEGNSCGKRNNNTWQIIDVVLPRNEAPQMNISQILLDLKPYTKYAAYVKTLTARKKNYLTSPTGQSKIIFFRTRSDVPSVATDLISFAVSDTEIVVKWGPPERPNGPIYYYIVSGFIRPDDEKLLESRDYCKHGLVPEIENEPVTEIIVRPSDIDPKSCCTKDEQTTLSMSKKFEIFCYENMTSGSLSSGGKNHCYSHRYNTVETDFYSIANNLSSSRPSMKDFNWRNTRNDIIDDTRTRIWNGIYYSFVHNVSMNNSSYLLKNLRHFSLYTISVAACGQKLENGTQMCSSIQYSNSRTKKRPSADDVSNVNVHVLNDTIVSISWDSPTDPNGLIVAHTIEYTNLIIKDAIKSTACVTHNNYRQKRGTHFLRNLSPGKYSVRVRSMSLAGEGNFSEPINFSIGLKEDNTIVLVLLLIFGFLATIFVVGYLVNRNHRRKRQQQRLIASVNPDYIECKYVKDSWEVPRDNVEILDELGLGNFGMVYRGLLCGATQVAIKTIPESSSDADKNEFLNEASVMKNFSTFHIIKLLGVVSDGSPPYVIMELMDNGDLKTYLRRIRETHLVPDVSRVIRMAGEIADGMAYLESKKFVHRDLAARNCMVSKDLVCKIGDFGMARDIYATDYYKIGKKGLLPIRWMAPENLSDGVFTSDSDVWSFGIVLYEILTLAEIPYQGFSNEEVLNYVLRRGTVNVPRNNPELIIKLMEKCFKWRPSERPTFMEIVAELEPFLSQDFCEKSFYHSEQGVEIRNLGLKKVYHHAAPIRFHWGNETARWVKEFEDNVTLLDQTKAGTSRGRIFKNGFQHFGNLPIMEDVPLDR